MVDFLFPPRTPRCTRTGTTCCPGGSFDTTLTASIRLTFDPFFQGPAPRFPTDTSRYSIPPSSFEYLWISLSSKVLGFHLSIALILSPVLPRPSKRHSPRIYHQIKHVTAKASEIIRVLCDTFETRIQSTARSGKYTLVIVGNYLGAQATLDKSHYRSPTVDLVRTKMAGGSYIIPHFLI